MKQVIVISGASSGFGALAARALARAGHTVYASMRDSTGRNATQVAAVARYAADNQVDLRTVELDVTDEASVESGVAKIVADCDRLDVIVHNAGHMSLARTRSSRPARPQTPRRV
jgi:NADP-dependent 3-hydroxy acid dehydrogenase YdfG